MKSSLQDHHKPFPHRAEPAPAKPGARTSLLPPPFTLALGIFRIPGSVL